MISCIGIAVESKETSAESGRQIRALKEGYNNAIFLIRFSFVA